MNITDVYNKNDVDHRLYLDQECLKLQNFSLTEKNELSDAMHFHGLKLLELMRAMRNYVQNPFGKYFTMTGENDGVRKTDGKNY